MIASNQYNAEFGVQCFQFWYWREFSLKNKLDVNLVSGNKIVTLWTSNLTFPTRTWHRASVTVTFTALQNIVIQATHLGIENNRKSIQIKKILSFRPATHIFTNKYR
jgi:hypothetical protein